MAARATAESVVEALADGENLTKNDLVRVVSKISNVKLRYARTMVDNVLFAIVSIIEEMRPNDRLEIRGFGVFKMIYRRALLTKHNPKNLKKIAVPAKRKIVWQPGKELKKKLLKLI